MKGGCYVIETTEGNGGWHTHIHAVVESKYLPQSELSERWEKASGGFIVDIRLAWNVSLVGYLTKYLTKPVPGMKDRAAFSATMKGRRLFNVFGDWVAKERTIPRPKYCCPTCGESQWMVDFEVYRESDLHSQPP